MKGKIKMKLFREHRDVILLVILVLFTITSALNIAKVNQMQEKLDKINTADKIVITEETKVDEKEADKSENKHPHNWKVISSNNSKTKAVIACDGCGELKYIDYVNNQIKEAE